MATGWGSPSEVKLPLLPYERDLIDALGCTAEEYEEYRKSLINYGRRRPAAYDHIPDVRNEPTTIAIISLVVGLALTAASALLAPKPKKPEQQEDRRKKLDDDISKSRFNTTQGFDGAQSITTLGTPVAAFFGKREGKLAACSCNRSWCGPACSATAPIKGFWAATSLGKRWRQLLNSQGTSVTTSRTSLAFS